MRVVVVNTYLLMIHFQCMVSNNLEFVRAKCKSELLFLLLYFDVLLTVHLTAILVMNEHNAQNFVL